MHYTADTCVWSMCTVRNRIRVLTHFAFGFWDRWKWHKKSVEKVSKAFRSPAALASSLRSIRARVSDQFARKPRCDTYKTLRVKMDWLTNHTCAEGTTATARALAYRLRSQWRASMETFCRASCRPFGPMHFPLALWFSTRIYSIGACYIYVSLYITTARAAMTRKQQ